ncbi:MAG TPA: GGDEF domain-containing protein [Anaerolineales bacterium]|nr:GGDEF domain-containing protein [Anaerolineales bacterium]
MFRTVLKRYGITIVTLGLTLISIVLSLGITWGVRAVLGGIPGREDLAIAIVAPLIIAPLMSVQMLRLLLQLDEAEQRLQILSYTDDLTQVYNRRYFMQYIDKEFRRAQRYGETFSIAILDLDNFKEINDTWGHHMGDEVLRALPSVFRVCVRNSDICARYGGDEFVFLFPKADRQQSEAWARRIYKTFAQTTLDIESLKIRPLFSMGIAVFHSTMGNFDDMLKQADEALYQAKRMGGNQFILNRELS